MREEGLGGANVSNDRIQTWGSYEAAEWTPVNLDCNSNNTLRSQMPLSVQSPPVPEPALSACKDGLT